MVAYHFFFDLYFLGLVPVDVLSGPWLVLARTSSTLFQLLVGVSLVLSWRKQSAPRAGQGSGWGVARRLGQNPAPNRLFSNFVKRSWRRALVILGWAAVITVATWLVAPAGTVWFGILHLIGVSIVLTAPLVRWPKVTLALAATVWWLGQLAAEVAIDSPWLLWFGPRPVEFQSFDYWPLLPWLAVILLGVTLGHAAFPAGNRRWALPDWSKLPVPRLFIFLGRHSLAIYLIHQPIILLGLWAALLLA